MTKTILKGISSILIAVMVFGFLFLWQKDVGVMPNTFFSITAGILGYVGVAPFTMSKEEMNTFDIKMRNIGDKIEKSLEVLLSDKK